MRHPTDNQLVSNTPTAAAVGMDLVKHRWLKIALGRFILCGQKHIYHLFIQRNQLHLPEFHKTQIPLEKPIASETKKLVNEDLDIIALI